MKRAFLHVAIDAVRKMRGAAKDKVDSFTCRSYDPFDEAPKSPDDLAWEEARDEVKRCDELLQILESYAPILGRKPSRAEAIAAAFLNWFQDNQDATTFPEEILYFRYAGLRREPEPIPAFYDEEAGCWAGDYR